MTQFNKVELLKSQKQLSIMFDNIRDMLLMTLYEGAGIFRIVKVNQSYVNACNLYGLNIGAEGLIGMSLECLAKDFLKLEEYVVDIL